MHVIACRTDSFNVREKINFSWNTISRWQSNSNTSEEISAFIELIVNAGIGIVQISGNTLTNTTSDLVHKTPKDWVFTTWEFPSNRLGNSAAFSTGIFTATGMSCLEKYVWRSTSIQLIFDFWWCIWTYSDNGCYSFHEFKLVSCICAEDCTTRQCYCKNNKVKCISACGTCHGNQGKNNDDGSTNHLWFSVLFQWVMYRSSVLFTCMTGSF